MSDPQAFGRIEPTEANPMPDPPCGGSWTREADGGLVPADEATAIRAGLMPTADATQEA